MDQAKQFLQKADEARDLFYRGIKAFPLKSIDETLKARHEQRDPTVVKIDHGDGVITYDLEFTNDQREKLEAEFKKVASGFDVDDLADTFVSTIERYAKTALEFDARPLERQKQRERDIESVSVALRRLNEALSRLDSAALGHWYGHVVDALAKAGFEASPSDNQMVSMLNNPLRAMVEGGEMRAQMSAMLDVITEATTKSGSCLPKHDHAENDGRLKTALALERLILENRIAFEATETGFAAVCLRAIFDLAGIDVDRVSYWLKKAAEHPESFGKFIEKLRQSNV
jgi:hypothetical protein